MNVSTSLPNSWSGVDRGLGGGWAHGRHDALQFPYKVCQGGRRDALAALGRHDYRLALAPVRWRNLDALVYIVRHVAVIVLTLQTVEVRGGQQLAKLI